MTRRDGKAWLVDIAAILIALASLSVSVAANIQSQRAYDLSHKAWTRPAPADPTFIPTFGQSDHSETIDAGDGGRRFFAFLDKHPGRKIRIIANIGEGVEVHQTEQEEKNLTSTYFEIPRKCSPEQVQEGKPECDKDTLGISSEDEEKEKFGLEWNSGWVLEGYFANAGLVSYEQNVALREITGISIVTAVS